MFKQFLIGIGLVMSLISWTNEIHAETYKFVDVEAHPLGFYDEQGNMKGVAIDIFKHVIHKLGLEVDIKLGLPGNRVLYLIRTGQADGIPFIRKNDERETFLDYCKEPVFTENIMFYVRKGEEFEFEGNFMQLKDKRIGIRLGDSYGKAFNDAASFLNIESTGTIEQGFKKLLANRIDIVLSTRIRAAESLKKIRHQEEIIAISKPMDSVPLYVAFRKASGLTELRDLFDKELARAKADGEVQEIIQKWLE